MNHKRSIQSIRGIWVIGIFLLSVVCFATVQAADSPTVRIGIVRDGPWARYPDALDLFKKEITAVAEGQFDVRFTEGRELDGDWTADGIRRHEEWERRHPPVGPGRQALQTKDVLSLGPGYCRWNSRRQGCYRCIQERGVDHRRLPLLVGHRDVLRIGGAVGTAGAVAGAVLHGLYLFARRKDHVKAAEKKTEEASDE